MIDHGRFAVKASSCVRENFLAKDYFGVAIKSYQVEGGFAEVNTDRSDKRDVHAMILRVVFQIIPPRRLIQAADHLINRVITRMAVAHGCTSAVGT